MKEGFAGQSRKKITSLFNNQRRYQRSGSITTATIDKEDPLRQSRILNLPNYKKDTLDGRLDFVVVFQTIEIERLSVQIESLRVRLADRERQIFNYKNYEVQIRELTQRCYEYESEKINYQQQIAMLRQSLRQAQNDVEDFKEKCYSLEDALREQQEMAFNLKENLIIERKHREQLEEGRLMLESSIKQKEKQYSRQLRDMQKSTQFKRNELTKNQQHLGNLLKKYHQEVSSLQKQNLNLRNLYDSIQQQSQDLERRYQQLQTELYRSNELVKEKDFQLDTLQQQNRQRLQILQQRYEEEYNLKCKRVQQYEQQVNGWKGEVDKLQHENEKYQLKITEYNEQIQRYQVLLNEAGDEIDRLNTIIKDKNKYLDAWQTRFKDLQEKNNLAEETINSYNQKQVSDQQQIMRLTHALKYKSEQLEKYEKTREQEARAVKEKLQQIENTRQEIAAIKRQKEIQREDQKRRSIQNLQLKEQLNKRIVEGNRLFQELNKTQIQLKELKQSISTNETALTIKDQQLQKAKEKISNLDSRIQKLQLQKRSLEHDSMRIKALEERIKHEQNKKSEYHNESKRLGQKFKECQRQLYQSKRHGEQLEVDLEKFEKYTEQLIARVTQLQKKLQLLQQLKKEIAILCQKNQNYEKDLVILNETLSKKIGEIGVCKQKIHSFDKYMKQFKVREAQFKQQIHYYEKLESELKHQKEKYQNLEDKRDQLQIDLNTALAQVQNLAKENGSLERVIAINTQEIQRTEKLLSDAREELLSQKDKEKQIILKVKETQKRIKANIYEIDKEKDKITKEKQELQKLLERKTAEFESELKRYNIQRQALVQRGSKELKELQAQRDELSQENNSFRMLVKKYEQQKDKQNKICKQLQKKIIGYQHQLHRIAENDSEAKKQLQISFNKIEKLGGKIRECQMQLKEQLQRIGDLLTQKQRLLSQISDKQRLIASKETDNAHLLRENQLFQKQIISLRNELDSQQYKNAQLCGQLIKVKFQSESITQEYKGLNIRLSNMQQLIGQLKSKLLHTAKLGSKLQQDKKNLENKYNEYQQKLSAQIDRLEEQQFKQGQEIIRLDTLNRMLQIEIGQYKERQSAVFSIVKENSMLKEKKDISPFKQSGLRENTIKNDRENKQNSPVRKSRITSTNASRAIQKSNLKDSQQLLKESLLFGELISHRSKANVKGQEQLIEISYCEKREQGKGQNQLLKSSKKCLYFEDLVFKPI